MSIQFYGIEEIADELLSVAVIVSRYRNQWVMCKHRQRETWELPGGHREVYESIQETAKRELYEETGAKTFELTPMCSYYAKGGYAMLFFAEISDFDELPESEIEQVAFYEELPSNLTYPVLCRAFIDRACAWIKTK